MIKKQSIGIVGGGVVGSAVKSFFRSAKVYDKYKPQDPVSEVASSQFIFICVPTPYSSGLDLSIIDEALANVVSHLTEPEHQLVVIKSTVWPGTTQKYQDKYPGVNLAFNPEFLRDKTAAQDFQKNDRQIVGFTKKTKSSQLVKDLLAILPVTSYQRLVPAEVAEMIKYAGNTYLAQQVIFANQIYDVCQALGVDYELVKAGIKSDKRIGTSHWEIWHTESSLSSTKGGTYRGYGGKCFPKEMYTVIDEAKKLGVAVPLFSTAQRINHGLNGGKYDK